MVTSCLYAATDSNCACGIKFTDQAKLDTAYCSSADCPNCVAGKAYRPIYVAWSKSMVQSTLLYHYHDLMLL